MQGSASYLPLHTLSKPTDAIAPWSIFLRMSKLLRSRSVVPTMEDFDPALFMTVLHATASFNDIRNGLESLNGAKANQVRAPRVVL